MKITAAINLIFDDKYQFRLSPRTSPGLWQQDIRNGGIKDISRDEVPNGILAACDRIVASLSAAIEKE